MASKASVASLKLTPPKSESVPVIDPQHPPLSSLGKQGTFTKEKSSSPESVAAKEEEQSITIRRSVSSASIGSDSTSATTTWSGMDDQTSSTPPQKRTPPKKVAKLPVCGSKWKRAVTSRKLNSRM
ncbi:hypothetical protein GHT06_014802 [Daphnia sinensis]|uniref:Uncharacterized protein n=1 Tax=Daphnia sinensis TaxID=1820382 RepID=A0AAD5KQC9_9CRUS|nr:hypothetical protein GHT06_014802 [Daphnia sinensis]